MRRLLWLAWWAGVSFLVAILACLVLAIGWVRPVDRLYSQVSDKSGETAKIAVFGDTQKGLAAFAALADRARAEGIDLAIHTGDLVSRADMGHYTLAIEWVNRAKLGPFVVAPGNHDIKGGEGLFEDLIGPRQLAFRWGPVDIVIVDNAVAPPDLAAVDALLKKSVGRPILVFMHVPPVDPAKKMPKPEYESFLRVIRQYPVRYVFSGHAHDYTRFEDNRIVFISNGVGGDSDSWQFDQKAYLTIVEADSKSIKDRSVVIEPVLGIRANIEHLAIGHVGEIVFRRIWGTPALLLLIVILALAFRRLRKKKPPPEPEKEKLKLRFTPAKTSDPPDIVI